MGPGRQAGFTLIESMVVIAILGIVAAISIPSMQRARMRATMLEVVRTFETATAVARINAIKRSTNVCMRILDTGDPQQITSFRAWIETVAENEIEDAGEPLVGEWQVRRANEWTFEDVTDAGFPLYVLDKTGGGTDRGIVYLPNGMALTSDTTRQPGVGQGAFDYYIWQGGRRWNTFRFTIFAGAGTVRVQMNIPGTSNWDDKFAYWEYY